MSEQCCNRVSDGWHSRQCTRSAKVERDGKWYCGQHDPVAIEAKDKARREKRDREWEEERKARKEKERLEKQRDAALALVKRIAEIADQNPVRGPLEYFNECNGYNIDCEWIIAEAVRIVKGCE